MDRWMDRQCKFEIQFCGKSDGWTDGKCKFEIGLLVSLRYRLI